MPERSDDEAELVAIVTGIAPAIKTSREGHRGPGREGHRVISSRVDDLVRELTTVREALRAAEGRRLDLEARCAGLEQTLVERLLELEARIATVRP